MPQKINCASRKKYRESGFSLIELMISIVVFLIFISVIYGTLRVAHIQKSTVNSETEVMTNLRLSLNTVGRDAVNSGLRYSRVGGTIPDNLTNLRMQLPADANNTQDTLTAVIAGNNINANNFLPVGQNTDVIAFAYRDMEFNGGNPISITTANAIGTGGVALTTAANAALNSKSFDLYLISNESRTVVALATGKPDNNTLQFATGAAVDILGINAPYYTGSLITSSRLTKCSDLPVPAAPALPSTECMNYGTENPVLARKIIWVSYHVTADGTLTRTIYGNNNEENNNATAAEQIQTQPLAYNISNFQIRYLLRDGTSSEDPSVGGTNQNVLNNVVQVEVTISSKINVKENGVNLERVVDLKSSFSTKNLNYD